MSAKHPEEDLSGYVMCNRCNTLYHKVQLPPGKRARCTRCGAILYRYDPVYLDRALSFSLAGIILFVVANAFPLVRITLWGKEHDLTIVSSIMRMADEGYYIVAVGVALLVLLIPALILVDYAVLIVLLKWGRQQNLARQLLVLLSRLAPWSMVDIFAVSILVALVKLSGEVGIYFGLSFWALVLYIGIDIYLTKARRIGTLWEVYERQYRG